VKFLQQRRALATRVSTVPALQGASDAAASCSGRLTIAVQQIQRRDKSALTTTNSESMSAVTKSLLLDTLNLVCIFDHTSTLIIMIRSITEPAFCRCSSLTGVDLYDPSLVFLVRVEYWGPADATI
jgi:hypothetical protein